MTVKVGKALLTYRMFWGYGCIASLVFEIGLGCQSIFLAALYMETYRQTICLYQPVDAHRRRTPKLQD